MAQVTYRGVKYDTETQKQKVQQPQARLGTEASL